MQYIAINICFEFEEKNTFYFSNYERLDEHIHAVAALGRQRVHGPRPRAFSS